MQKKIILFDFDGVIVDSFDIGFLVSKKIHPVLTESTFQKLFEGNINESLRLFQEHDAQCRHDIDFFKEYLPKLAQVSTFPGMLEVIDELRKQFRLVVVSSTISSPIREYLEGHNIAGHFDDILGNDIHTSKVEKIKIVIEKYSAAAADCVFVTDTLGDIRETEKAGIGVIAVSWGFHPHATLKQGHPFRVVDTPQELKIAVESYFVQEPEFLK